MFCKNCGIKLEDGTKFCSNCGAPQDVVNTPQEEVIAPNPDVVATQPQTPEAEPVATVPQGSPVESYVPQGDMPQNGTVPYNPATPVVPKKKNNGCLIAAIIAIAVFVLIVIGVIAVVVFSFNTVKDVINDADIAINEDSNVSEYVDDAVSDLTYEEIFSTYNVIDTPAFFNTKESCAFAYADTDGYIEKSEYGYEDDVIIEMVDTYYYPIGEYEKEQADSYIDFVKAEFKADEELSCCTVTYNTTESYFIVTEKFTNVDKADTLTELQDAGFVTADYDIDYLSMSQTEQDYLDMGFVKK